MALNRDKIFARLILPSFNHHKIILSRGKSHQLSNQVKVREPASFEILNELAGRISRISILHIVVSQTNNGTTLIIVLLEYKLIYLFE